MSIKKDGSNVILSAAPDKVIFAELKNKQACKDYANCISGTFQYQNAANAILSYNGKVFGSYSAHGWLGYPDSCLIYYKDGSFAVKRWIAIPSAELNNIRWAISGVGLLDMYNPAVEGYARFQKNGKTYDYSDVLRRTNHTAIGVKGGQVYGLYLANMTGAEVNAYCKKQGMQYAIMLDGGHIAAVNCGLAQQNASQKQHNIIQFVGADKEEEDGDIMSKKKVCIDPGHGGTDSGAVGQNGTKEKDVVLQIGLLVKAALERNGIDVVMTREKDIVSGKLVIADRCKIANNAGVDYLVSIHANADGDRDDKTGFGTETWAYSTTSAGYSLAKAVQRELIAANGLTDRGVKAKAWDILKGTKAPAILVETAFINNSAEERLLIDAAFQKLTAEAIAKGIVQQLGQTWVPTAAPETKCNLKIVDRDAGTVKECVIEQENRNGIIWAPVRQMAEVLGCQVGYDSSEKCVVIYR